MKKTKSRILAVLLFSIAWNIHATSAAPKHVIDVTAIIHAIENGYKLMQEVNNTIQTLDATQKMLTNQIKTFQNIKLDELDASDPLKSWTAIMSYGDRLMSVEDSIEATVNAKTMHIGNGQGEFDFSLADMFSKNTYDKLPAAFDDPTKPMTLEEKADFHAKYGMSPAHYKKYAALSQTIANAAAETYVRAEAYNDATKLNGQQRDAVLQKMKETDSVANKLDGLGTILNSVGADIKAMGANASGTANLESTRTAYDIAKDAEDKETWNSQNPTISSNWFMAKEKAEEKYRSIGAIK